VLDRLEATSRTQVTASTRKRRIMFGGDSLSVSRRGEADWTLIATA
jgi:hypothetical protein